MKPIKYDFSHTYICFPDINLDLINSIIDILGQENKYNVQISDEYSEYDSIDDVIENKGNKINSIILRARSKEINNFMRVTLGAYVHVYAGESAELTFYKLKKVLEDFLKKNRFNKIIKITKNVVKIVCISVLCFIIIKLLFGEWSTFIFICIISALIPYGIASFYDEKRNNIFLVKSHEIEEIRSNNIKEYLLLGGTIIAILIDHNYSHIIKLFHKMLN